MICSRIAFLIVVIGFHIASFAAEGPNRDAAETAPPALEGTTWRVVAYRAESSLVPIETSETLPRIKLAEGGSLATWAATPSPADSAWMRIA
jgi:hypothetical protein